MLKKGYFLFLLPFLDFFSYLHPVCFNIVLGIKGILFLLVVFFLLKRKENRKILSFLGIFLVLFLTYCLKTHLSFGKELTYILTLFSLPTLLLFFTTYKGEAINKQTMTIVSCLYFILFLIANLFSLTTFSSIYLLFITFSLSFVYLVESHSYLLKLFFLLLFVCSSLFIKAKTFYLSFLLLFIGFLLCNVKQVIAYLKKDSFKTLLTVLVITLGISVYLPNMHIEEILPLKYTSINDVFHGRIENIKNANQNFVDGSGLQKLLGFGVENKILVDIDALDIFYSVGFVGSLFYLIYFAYALKQTKLKKNYTFIFILVLLLSCLGNVLVNPYLVFFIACLVPISKTDTGIRKKDILLVSNMYPDRKNPHYGVFVKNTYDLLVENGYTIDLVIMNKTIGKFKKLIAYIRLCGLSLLKATFLNYDSIYVHFASHTPAGIFIPKLLSRDTKLVMNVHGNDVVPDTKTDQNYLLLTKIFLKASDTIIAPSNYFKKVLIKNYSIDKKKIVVYPSGGINTEVFKKINKKTALKNASLDAKYKYFGFVGRIDKDKGYDTYLKAINELKKSKKLDKNIRFILVGSGREEAILDSLIKKYKVEKLIIRKPMVSQEELVSIYNSLEALVYPTRMKSESLGLVGLEAMATSTLVIGPNKYGPSDYLNDENSLLFNPSNEKELAKKILEVLSMKTTTKNKKIKNALKTVDAYTNQNTKAILLNAFKKNA